MSKSRILTKIFLDTAIVLLLVLVLYAVPAAAVTVPQDGPLKLTLEEAKQLALEHSYDRQRSALAEKRLSLEQEDVGTLIDDTVHAQVQLMYAQIMLGMQRDGLIDMIALLNPADPADAPELTVLYRQLEQMHNQLNTFSTAIEDSKEGTKALHDALEKVKMARGALDESRELLQVLISFSVEQHYVTLLALECQEQSLEQSLAALQREIRAGEVKSRLGLVSNPVMDAYYRSLYQLQNHLDKFRLQHASAATAFKKMLGLPPEQEILLKDPELAVIKPDYEKGLAQALQQGLDVRRSQSEVDRLKVYLLNVQERYGHTSSNARKAAFDLREAQIKQAEVLTEVGFNYRMAYNELLQNQKSLHEAAFELAFARNYLRYARLRYELGVLSRLEFEAAETEYAQKGLAHKQAQYNLYKAESQFVLASQGVVQPAY